MALATLTFWLEALPKALVYIALPIGLGTCSVRWFVLPPADLTPDQREQCEWRLARLAAASFALLVLALLARLPGHTFAAFGSESWLSAESLRVIAVESQWGTGWQWQMATAMLALASALLIGGHREIGWPTTTVAAAACCFATPLLGHAAGSATRVSVHAAHLAGAGIWLGALAAIVLVGPRASLLRTFTPIAIAGAALVVLAGLTMAVTYVGRISNLWSSAYGLAFASKLAIFGGVLGCGYLNWRRWGATSKIGDHPLAADADTRLALIESVLAVLVVLITAVLTELEHP